ncbi:MAG: hypothetical protein KIS90_10895, partial [Phenylobacterium sp.]|nr:hypothetical protein [Phenylobacterium sp.]
AVIDGLLYGVSAAPIPDALAGVRSLSVTQDRGGGDTHVTALACQVTSSQGRTFGTGTYKDYICTANWRHEKEIEDVCAAHTRRYQGETIAPANSVAVTSATGLWAAIQAFHDGTAGTGNDGATWFEVRCRNGSYTGGKNEQSWDFGANGGVRILPETGHDPELWFTLGGSFRTLDFSGLRLIPAASGPNTIMFSVGDPGPRGILGHAGAFSALAIHHCRIGLLHAAGYTLPDVYGGGQLTPPVAPQAGRFLLMRHGESAYLCDNEIDGIGGSTFGVHGVRAVTCKRNHAVNMSADFLTGSNAYGATSTQGVFADDDCYWDFADNVVPRELDYPGLKTNAHGDMIQMRSFAENMDLWVANSYKRPNNPSPAWAPSANGTFCLRNDPAFIAAEGVRGRIYRVREQTTVNGAVAGKTGPTGPVGTANGQVDGGVIWDYVQDYTTPSAVHIKYSQNYVASGEPISDANVLRQMLIDSNGSYDCPVILSANNNRLSSNSTYGLHVGRGRVWAERNVMAASYHSSLSNSLNLATIWSGSYQSGILPPATIYSRGNMTRAAVNTASQRLFAYRDVVINWQAQNASEAPVAVLGQRPEDFLAGPFDLSDFKSGKQYAFTQLDTSAGYGDFRAALEAVLAPLVSYAGPILGGAYDDDDDDEDDDEPPPAPPEDVPPTAYAMTVGAGVSVRIGTAIPLVITLNRNAVEDVQIEVDVGGFGGDWTGGPVVTVPAGERTAAATFVPESRGALTFTPAATPALDDPGPVSVQVVRTTLADMIRGRMFRRR